ncbi:MAG: hypothetical protein LUH10_12355 [Tannerellaceae bacterium]|nr:hypothetical protein [Tannerellaceae bacterium]
MNILKNRTNYLLLILLLFTGIACSDDNDDNISKEAKAFVGEWKCKTSSKPDWVFRADGTCTMKPSLASDEEGFWEYDSKKKRLSTTCGNWAWDIQIVTENEWSGVTVNTESVYAYSRVGTVTDNTQKLQRKWSRTNGTNTYTLTITASTYSFLHKNGNSTKASYSGDCKIQDNGNDSFAIVMSYSGKQATFTGRLNTDGSLRLTYLTMGSNISDLKVIEGTYN